MTKEEKAKYLISLLIQIGAVEQEESQQNESFRQYPAPADGE